MCRSRFVASAVGLVSVVGAAAPTGVADTLVPLDQERFTSVLVQSDCEGETSAGKAAKGFELFDSLVATSQECPEDPKTITDAYKSVQRVTLLAERAAKR